jgi:hypothetical protein
MRAGRFAALPADIEARHQVCNATARISFVSCEPRMVGIRHSGRVSFQPPLKSNGNEKVPANAAMQVPETRWKKDNQSRSAGS